MTVVGISPAESPGFVAAIGCFDGVHIGHAALLRETVRIAKERGLLPAVFTFDAGIPYKDYQRHASLMTEDEKEALLFASGIQTVFRVSFPEVCDLSPDAFVSDVLRERLKIRFAVVGDDFRYGKNAAGNAAQLSAGIETAVVPPVLYRKEKVSSTRIRLALENGETDDANAMLGHDFGFSSRVVHGKALGRTIGFPTLNTPLPDGIAEPRYGVYVSRIIVGRDTYDALTAIGVRPSVEQGASPNAESHLLHASGDFYDLPVRVELRHFLRPEQKFPDVAALQRQLINDKKEAIQWITKSTQS